MRILVAEDEPELARHVTRALARCGHSVSVERNGKDALSSALSQQPDLLVLDLNLPGLDGLSILLRVRTAQLPTRVLILTARGELQDRVKGLKAGADAMEELLARIDALGRRGGAVKTDSLEVADLRMNVSQRRVIRAGQIIKLSPREFELLHVLMAEPGRIFSRTELCERVWQRDYEYDTRTVEVFIARLRKKVDSAFPTDLIQTLRSVGYTIRAS
jgi:DNA-binding response OmpR family regulator